MTWRAPTPKFPRGPVHAHLLRRVQVHLDAQERGVTP